MKGLVIGCTFFTSWLLCGCAIETALDDWRAGLIVVISVVVCAVTAALITSGDE